MKNNDNVWIIQCFLCLLGGFFFGISTMLYYSSTRHIQQSSRDLSVTETRIKIGVIDTGIKYSEQSAPYLCKVGHKDLTGTGLEDRHGHGTNIVGIISKGVDSEKYCFVIYKYYDLGGSSVYNSNLAFMEAFKDNLSYLNYSSGGTDRDPTEEKIVKLLLEKGVKITVAAGNNGDDLGKNCNYFPACITDTTGNLYTVANCAKPGVYSASSNYGGPAKQCENGVGVIGFGHKMTGTSQAAALFMNKLILGLVK